MARQVFRKRTGAGVTQNNAAFIGGTTSPAVSGQLSQIQLFNPVGSGRRLFLLRLRARSVGATVVYGDTTPLTTLTTNATNKLASPNSASPVGEVRIGSNPAPKGGSRQEGIVEVINTDIPIILEPGYGANVEGATVNQEAGALFEWVEDIT